MSFLLPSAGIFLSNELWHNEMLKGKNFEFKIWSLPAIENVKARRVAHLLNELPMPTNQRNATVELRTDSFNSQFESVLKSENLCFKTTKSADKKLVSVYVGEAEFMNAQHFPSNESQIIVPLSTKNFVMASEQKFTSLLKFLFNNF